MSEVEQLKGFLRVKGHCYELPINCNSCIFNHKLNDCELNPQTVLNAANIMLLTYKLYLL
jgi:hypothetical protein